MELLKLDNEVQAFPTPACSEIPEFKEVIEKEDNPAVHLAYIYHMNSKDSPYVNYSSRMREEEVKSDLYGDKNREPPEHVKKAEEKYVDLTTTPEQRLLESAIDTIYKYIDYFDDIDPTERDDNNKPVYKMKDVTRVMEKLPGVVDTLEDLRDRVDKGEGSSGEIRGDVELTEYNK